MTDYTLECSKGTLTVASVGAAVYARWVVGPADEAVLTDTSTYKWYPDGAMAETIGIGDVITPHMAYASVVGEGLIFGELTSFGIPVAIVDTVEIAEATTVLRGLIVLDELGITDGLDGAAKYGVTLTQAILFSDGLFHFFSENVIETMFIAENLTQNFYATARIEQNMSLTDALTNKLLLRVDIAENIEFDEAHILKMIFNGELFDAVDIRATFVSPDGGITTWAINSRTGSVTEYRNWQFSSFAQIGNSFVAAGKDGDGLYLLEGSRDDGANIVARMRGGILELNGSRFTSFKGAYLGLRSRDDAAEFLLKLIDPAGKEFIYAVKAKDMRTTKVNMGKGLRSRYWQWELISLAADFDLDSIEFIPLMPARRV